MVFLLKNQIKTDGIFYLQVIKMEVLKLHTYGMCQNIKFYDGSNRSTALFEMIGGYDLIGDIFSDSSLFIYYYSCDWQERKEWFKIRYTISEYNQGKV